MTLDEAIAILNREGHRDARRGGTEWHRCEGSAHRPLRDPKDIEETGGSCYLYYDETQDLLTDFEAIAIAEKYERQRLAGESFDFASNIPLLEGVVVEIQVEGNPERFILAERSAIFALDGRIKYQLEFVSLNPLTTPGLSGGSAPSPNETAGS